MAMPSPKTMTLKTSTAGIGAIQQRTLSGYLIYRHGVWGLGSPSRADATSRERRLSVAAQVELPYEMTDNCVGRYPERPGGVVQEKVKVYRSERQLVRDFVRSLRQSPWGPLAVTREFNYHRGKADVVGVCDAGSVVAFEAKLTRWRGALQQAYRNTCFAHRSYVLLPWQTAQVARKYWAEFDKRKVGLCTVQSGQVVVLHEARSAAPLQPWLTAVASSQRRRTIGDCSPRPAASPES